MWSPTISVRSMDNGMRYLLIFHALRQDIFQFPHDSNKSPSSRLSICRPTQKCRSVDQINFLSPRLPLVQDKLLGTSVEGRKLEYKRPPKPIPRTTIPPKQEMHCLPSRPTLAIWHRGRQGNDTQLN